MSVDARKEYLTKYYAENREVILARHKANYEKNRAKVADRARARKAADPEEARRKATAAMREWRARNPERAREQRRKWCERNPEKERDNRRRQTLRQYGLTPEDFDRMLTEQGGLCAICRKKFAQVTNVDHDHCSGEVRGLLCVACNGALGFVEREGWLESAQAYLRKGGTPCR